MFQVYIKTITIILGLCLASISFAKAPDDKKLTPSQAEELKADKHYSVLTAKFRKKPEVMQFIASSEKPVQAIMFFSHLCYWCSILDTPFNEWGHQQEKIVDVYQMPVAYNKVYNKFAKAYFAAKYFTPNSTINKAIFNGLHKESLPLWKKGELEKLFVKNGITEQEYTQVTSSMQIENQVKQADNLSLAFEILTTPNIIIIGKKEMFLTNLVMAKEPDKLMAILDHLVQLAQQ